MLDAGGNVFDSGGIDFSNVVTLLSTRRTQQPRSATYIEDVEAINAVTNRHNVTFERIVPHATFVSAGWQPLVAEIAYAIDSAMDQPIVVGAIAVQTFDASELLVNAIDFTVQVPAPNPAQGGPFTTTVEVTIQSMVNGGDWFAKIRDAADNLAAQVG